MNLETRLLYIVAFTLLGVVIAVYVLPVKQLPEFTKLEEVLEP